MRITRQGQGPSSTETIMGTLSDPDENHIPFFHIGTCRNARWSCSVSQIVMIPRLLLAHDVGTTSDRKTNTKNRRRMGLDAETVEPEASRDIKL